MRQLHVFTVSLFYYGYTSQDGVRLTPVASASVWADTPARASRLLMQQCGVLFVDHAEVVLSDGSRLVYKNLLVEGVYDVALWTQSGAACVPLLLDRVRASSPLGASLLAMRHYQQRYVDRVAVKCPSGAIWSKSVLRLDLSEGETHE